MEKETSIPKEQWGVHETHCCEVHGCKYSKVDCPVKIGLIAARHECEYCVDDARENYPQYSTKVAKELTKLGQRYLFDTMLQMTKLDEEEKLKFLVDKNEDLSLRNTINKHNVLRTPEEKQHVIDLGKRFKLEDKAFEWWDEPLRTWEKDLYDDLNERKRVYLSRYQRITGCLLDKTIDDLSRAELVGMYSILYGD